MALNCGRRSAYDNKISSRLEEVKAWLAKGLTVGVIADKLGVDRKTIYNSRAAHPEFEALFADSGYREEVITKLHAAALQSALGGIVIDEETTTTKDASGRITGRVIKRYARHVPPNIAAINLLLKNWDKARWSNDPAELELKKRQLELQERQIESTGNLSTPAPLKVEIVDAALKPEVEAEVSPCK